MGERTRQLTRHFGGLLRPADAGGDAELLSRFAAGRDEAAFAALVRRHGPMVVGVCRRILRDSHAADDAFQATFLVLARRAASLRDRSLLANWLYGVAYRTALEARRAEAVRRVKESRAAAMTDRTTGPDEPAPDLRDVLDRELAALPDVYRAAVVLCDLEGLPRAEAAKRLGWTEGTLSGRLARARALLAKRLARYGLSVAGVATVTSAAEGLSGVLIESTARAAALVAAGEALAGVVPVSVVELSQGVVKAMYVSKLKGLVAGVMVAGTVAWTGAVGTLSEANAGPQNTPATKKADPRPAAKDRDADRIAQLERERDALLRQLANLEARLNALEAQHEVAKVQEAVARQRAEVARDELERLKRNPILPTLNAPSESQLSPLPAPSSSTRPSANAPRSELPPIGAPTPISPTTHPDPLPGIPPQAIDHPPLSRPSTTNILPIPGRPQPAASTSPRNPRGAPAGSVPSTPPMSSLPPPALQPHSPSVLRVYPVEDLAADENQSQSVVRIIMATIEPRSWQMMGGEGVVEYFAGKKSLVVRQSPEVHKQLTELFELLRAKPVAPPTRAK